MQLMDDKTKFIQYIDWHRTKAEKMRVQNAKVRAAMADHGELSCLDVNFQLTLQTSRSRMSAQNWRRLRQPLQPRTFRLKK